MYDFAVWLSFGIDYSDFVLGLLYDASATLILVCDGVAACDVIALLSLPSAVIDECFVAPSRGLIRTPEQRGGAVVPDVPYIAYKAACIFPL